MILIEEKIGGSMVRLRIDSSRMDTMERRLKLATVAEEMHQVLNSTFFRDKVLQIKKWGERSPWKDKSNMEVYQKIMSGAEVLSPKPDKELFIIVDDYWSPKKVIGYTYPNTETVYVNTRFFDKRHRALIGSNLLHEISHKLGFSHDHKATKARPFSVSYQLNKAYEAAYSKIYNVYPVKKSVGRRSWRTLWIKKIYKMEEIWPEY